MLNIYFIKNVTIRIVMVYHCGVYVYNMHLVGLLNYIKAIIFFWNFTMLCSYK